MTQHRREAEEYSEALGQIFGGGWRLILHAEREGIPQALGMTTRQWVQEKLGGYIRLSIPERREAVLELTEDVGLSLRQAAKVLGVGEATIRRDRANAPHGASQGDSQIETEPSNAPNDAPQLSRALYSSDSDDWRTPKEIIDAAVAVLGAIDLDPCSDDAETPNVPAATWYTETDNGLAQKWAGTVYMNPPYGRVIEEWVAKLVSHYVAGDVTAAITLVPARTDTQWFRLLRDYPVCFVTGRLRFSGAEPAPFPSAAFYLGGEPARFHREFNQLGDIYARWEPNGSA